MTAPWLYEVEAYCPRKGCGAIHRCHTLVPPDPGQGPVARTCDACAEADYAKTRRLSVRPVRPVDAPTTKFTRPARAARPGED